MKLKMLAVSKCSDEQRNQEEKRIINGLNDKDSLWVQADKQRLLVWASYYGNMTVVRYLIAKGVSLNISHNKIGSSNYGKTPLHWAYDRGHYDVVRALLEAGAVDVGVNCEFKSRSERGKKVVIANQFLIHQLIKDGQFALLQTLLDKQPHLLEQRNGYGETPLLLAVKYHFIQGARFLVSRGSDVNAACNQLGDPNYGKTVLHWAYELRPNAMLNILLRKGAVDTPFNGESVFDRAVKDGRLDIIALLIEFNPNFWREKAHLINQWIGLAAGCMVQDYLNPHIDIWEPGFPDVVQYFARVAKEKGIDINLQSRVAVIEAEKELNRSDKKMSVFDLMSSKAYLDEPIHNPGHMSHGITPVQWAYECGHYIEMGLLLDAGALVDERTGQRLIFEATRYAKISTVERLLDKYPNLKNHTKHLRGTVIGALLSHDDFLGGQFPFILAARNGYKHIVRYLIERGQNPNMVIDNPDFKHVRGKTVLHLAYEARQYAIVEMLIDAGAQDMLVRGHYLVHDAAKNGHLNIIKLLLKHNPTLLNQTDEFEQTPLLWAASKGHVNIVQYLVDMAADLNAPTQLPAEYLYQEESGRTPLDWAIKNGHAAVCEVLIRAKAKANIYMDKTHLFSSDKDDKKMTQRQRMCRHTNACPGGFKPKWIRNSLFARIITEVEHEEGQQEAPGVRGA
ncbi:MAG: ankyrin repeat domain-containing protein [Legionellaceae bacterium]|nr:ankyrin repeat domain-containing protein [Legionellaceae bacterium]